MAADDFFNRWSKRNAEAAAADKQTGNAVDTPLETATPAVADAADAPVVAKPLPTIEDVAHLTHDSDFSGFMAEGVDESVKRSAMKKLFSNPHFNVMDGLDTYIEDYSKFEPMTAAMVAALNHGKALLDPLSQFQAPLMQLLEKVVEKTEAEAAAEEQSAVLEAPGNATPPTAPATQLELQADPQTDPQTETEPPVTSTPEPNHRPDL